MAPFDPAAPEHRSATDAMIPAWVDGRLVPVEKLEVHRRGLRHKAVSVFVMRGDTLLIQQRALEKYHTPGLWANTCCTHPHWNEEPAICAVRSIGNPDTSLGVLSSIRVTGREMAGGTHPIWIVFRKQMAMTTTRALGRSW